MNYLRGFNKCNLNNSEELEIQLVGWHCYDDNELNENCETDINFNVLLSGIDSQKRSVCVFVEDFQPFFYIKVPSNWRKSDLKILVEYCRGHYTIDSIYADDLVDFQLVKRKPFYGYTHDDMFKFGKLIFRNQGAFRQYQRIFQKYVTVSGLFNGNKHYYELFESSVEPMLRMMHVRDIQASGWIRIPPKKYIVNKEEKSNSQYDITVTYKNIYGIKKDSVGDIIFAGFDIEADSSHGDFPIAHKDYKKLARDIFNEYINLVNNKVPVEEITKFIYNFIVLAFEDYFNQNQIDYIGIDSFSIEALNLIVDKIDEDMSYENVLGVLQKYINADCTMLSKQLVSEHKRLLYINDHVYIKNKKECLLFMLKLAFDKYYNASNINVVYTQNNIKPSIETIEIVSKKTLEHCLNYSDFIKKKKRLNANKKNLVSRKEKDSLKEELSREEYDLSYHIECINNTMNEHFPSVKGDNLIQIGTTFQKLSEPDCFLKHIIVLDTCDNINNDELVRDENKDTTFPLKDLEKFVKKYGPSEFGITESDIGKYIKNCSSSQRQNINDKVIELNYKEQCKTDKSVVVVEVYHNMKDVLLAWTRLIVLSDVDVLVGYNIFGFDFKFMYECAQVCGCVNEFMQIGRMKGFVQKMHVQGHNIKDKNKKQSMDDMAHNIEMHGRLVIDLFKVIQTSYNLDSYKLDNVCEKFLYKNKNDLPPKEIFRMQKGDSTDRCTIAKYCIIDCVLCNRLLVKLQILMNNIGMSNVCSVPLMYLFLRGQGIKGLSFVSKICRSKGYLINTLKKQEETSEKYEGAIVLKPTTKIYIEDPVCVADFNSLYPSCMISENLSHDSLAGVYNCYKCKDIEKMESNEEKCSCYEFDPKVWKYAYIDNVEYVDIQYDIYDYIDDYNSQGMVKKEKKKIKSGIKTCRFAQLSESRKSIIPEILQELLKHRKNTRKIQKNFPENSFEWNIYEGLQLAYKITANSFYGLTGAQTSKIYLPEIAASTTATGRNLIKFTKKHYESNYDCKVVYGDTDSVFIKFNCKDIHGQRLHGLDAINKSIMYCTEGALAVSRQLKKPHNLEFEKAIFPFILISKKRYHGHYYTEYGSSSYSPKSMGIVLKRRDNANICKEIFGNAIHEIMANQDLEASLNMVKKCLRDLLDGKYPYDMFVISKTLRSYYKAPDTVAHNVLARRIARRDPGNKPQTNDRVPYIYIQVPGDDGKKKILQGDRVENPVFARENKLKVDYKFYLERQVMQPILQVFKLHPVYYEKCKKLFDDTLMEYELKRTKSQKITNFFKVIPKEKKETNIKVKENEEDNEEDIEEDNDYEDEEDKVDMASYEF